MEDNDLRDNDLRVELERLREENRNLKKSNEVTLKIATKGGISVYGLGRFPVTLYRQQWEKLLDMAEQIRQFIRDNDAKLKPSAPPR